MLHKQSLSELIENVEAGHSCIEALLRRLDHAVSLNNATIFGPDIMQCISDILAKHIITDEAIMNLMNNRNHANTQPTTIKCLLLYLMQMKRAEHRENQNGVYHVL